MFPSRTVQVVIPIPLDQSYTYSVPEDKIKDALPGRRVRISFHGRETIGIIWKNEFVQGDLENSPENFSLQSVGQRAEMDLQPILSFPEDRAVFSHAQMTLAKDIHEGYPYPLGKILQLMYPAYSPLPARAKKKINISSKEMPHSLSCNTEILLNRDQEDIFQEIKLQYHHRERVRAPILIHGITGSGKTEIYMQLFVEALRNGKSVLYLVPEISVTIQLQSRLEKVFDKERLIVFHSALANNVRYRNWLKLRSQTGVIVLGTRSSVFLPIRGLSLIVIDEEHDTSYKEQHSPPLDARVIAEMRSKNERCLLILGSATPRLETVYLARSAQENSAPEIKVKEKEKGLEQTAQSHSTHSNQYFFLNKRYGSGRLPPVELVGYEHASEKRHGITNRLLEQLKENISQGKKNLILFNRRGYFRSVYDQCQHSVLQCPNCSVSLIYHRIGNLRCHYCNYTQSYSPKKTEILTSPGIQQTESMLFSLFPNLRMARLDSDQMSRYSVVQTVMKEFLNGELDILLGTQMIAKGIDFADLEFVGVLEADAGLHFPDFRSRERTFAMLVQVAGRTGRSLKAGKVIFECWNPQAKVIQLAAKQNYRDFYENEIQSRRAYEYPPFSRLVRILFSGKNEEEVPRVCQEYADILKTLLNEATKILGPSPAPIHKMKQLHRSHLLIKTKFFFETLQAIRTTNQAQKWPATVQQLVDADPVDFL